MNLKIVYISCCFLVINSVTSFSQSTYFEISKNLEIFNNVFKELNTYYVDETKPGELMEKAIDSMLKELDPYTQFIPESEIEDFRFQTTGQYGGIGSLIRKVGDYVVIAEPYKGFPADKAGLKIGDRIIQIDDIPMKNKTVEDVSKLLKGEPGKKVNVTIERLKKSKYDIFSGQTYQEVTEESKNILITREKIKISSVPYHGMIDKYGYIKLSRFTRNCTNEVRSALLDLESKNELEGLILDLRMNPGGLLNEAIKLCNLFIEKDVLIVETKGRNSDWNKTYKTKAQPHNTDLPIIILVDQGSASASEIVAGTMQDLDRGIVIGNKTFGKGLVQQTKKLNYNSQLKLTVAKYYTPSGRCIQAINYSNEDEILPDSLRTEFKTKNGRSVFDGGGVDPDIIIDLDSIPKILYSLINKQLIFQFGNDYSSSKEKIPSPEIFNVSDSIYEAFIKFVNNTEFKFETISEKKIKELNEVLISEGYKKGLVINNTDLIQQLEKEIEILKIKDIQKYKKEISKLISSDLMVRYYYNRGRIQSSLKDDKAILSALELLKNKEVYNQRFLVHPYNTDLQENKNLFD